MCRIRMSWRMWVGPVNPSPWFAAASEFANCLTPYLGFSQVSSERSSRGSRCSFAEEAWRLSPVSLSPCLSCYSTIATFSPRCRVSHRGPEAATEAMLRALRPIVRDVAALTTTDQQHLMDGSSVVNGRRSSPPMHSRSMSSSSEASFWRIYFYRLNVFRFDVATSG